MDNLLPFTTVAETSILIAVAILIFRKKYLNTTELRILAIYTILTLIRNIIGVVADFSLFFTEHGFNNLFYYNWHNIIGFYLIVAIFYRLLNHKIWKTFVLVSCGIFTIFTFLEAKNGAITDINTANFNQYTYAIADLVVLIIVLAYFYQLLQDLQIENITKFSYFWMGVGLLFYFGGSLFVYLFVVKADRDSAQISWGINSFLSFLLYIALSFAFWYSNRLEKSHADLS